MEEKIHNYFTRVGCYISLHKNQPFIQDLWGTQNWTSSLWLDVINVKKTTLFKTFLEEPRIGQMLVDGMLTIYKK